MLNSVLVVTSLYLCCFLVLRFVFFPSHSSSSVITSCSSQLGDASALLKNFWSPIILFLFFVIYSLFIICLWLYSWDIAMSSEDIGAIHDSMPDELRKKHAAQCPFKEDMGGGD